METPKFYRIYLAYFEEGNNKQQYVEFYTTTLGEAIREIKLFSDKRSLCGHICRHIAENHLAYSIDRNFGVNGYLQLELRKEKEEPITIVFTNV